MFLNADKHFALAGEVCLPILPQLRFLFSIKLQVLVCEANQMLAKPTFFSGRNSKATSWVAF
jgi:hypothetical protein